MSGEIMVLWFNAGVAAFWLCNAAFRRRVAMWEYRTVCALLAFVFALNALDLVIQ